MPTIPDAAIEAARTIPVYPTTDEDGLLDLRDEDVRAIITSALTALLPGLFVTRHHGDTQIWREDPEHPDAPEAADGVQLAEILAGLLPDRTETMED